MGATKQLRMIMLDKDIKRKDFAEAYLSRPRIMKNGEVQERNGKVDTVYVMLSRDNMTYSTVEQMADILGCEIVFRDKETGKIY